MSNRDHKEHTKVIQELGVYQRFEQGDLGLVAYKLLTLDMKTVVAIYIEHDNKLIKTTLEEITKLRAQIAAESDAPSEHRRD